MSNKYIKKLYLKCFVFTFIALIAISCSNNEKIIAPTSLKGYTISYYTKKAPKYDSKFLNKSAIYEYHQNGTYKAFIDGKPVNFGNYTYRREKHNIGIIIMSYSDDTNQYGSSDYEMTLIFTDPSNGKWKAKFETDPKSIELGTFQLLKHRFE